MGWYGRRTKKVHSTKSRGNYCFKAFETKQKSIDDMKNHCSRFSSNLITNELLVRGNSTLSTELAFIIQKKFRLTIKEEEKLFGMNSHLDVRGGFFMSNIFFKSSASLIHCNSMQFEKFI